jgi:general secretion pathway protein F
LLNSGLPLDDALTALSKQSESADFKRVALDVRARVLEGHGLAAGLDQFPKIFPPVYRATIAAGAQTRICRPCWRGSRTSWKSGNASRSG